MQVELTIKKEYDIKSILVNAKVRYFEDAAVNGVQDEEGSLIPCRDKNGNWCPEIELETGKILNWEIGKTASIHYKVCDNGTYSLKDAEGEIIYSQESYVPNFLAIDDEGFGDYIIITVDENGFIQNWNNEIDFDSFFSIAF